jgi:hypothetical protein
VGVLSQFNSDFLSTDWASHGVVDAIIGPSDGLVAVLAMVAALNANVLGGAELGTGIDRRVHAGKIPQPVRDRERKIPR